MSKFSREKGKRGEREFAAILREHGFDSARRGVQFSGGPNSSDIFCEELPVHFEVKRMEKPNLAAAYKQASADSHISREPAVVVRRSNEPWMVYAAASHYLGMWQQILRLRSERDALAIALEKTKHKNEK